MCLLDRKQVMVIQNIVQSRVQSPSFALVAKHIVINEFCAWLLKH